MANTTENKNENEKTNVNDIINTTESVKNNKTDNQLQSEQLKKSTTISKKSPRKKFKCSSVYAALFPEGLTTTYQGIVINLIFDNSTVELPKPICNYIEGIIQRKADKEAEKLNRFRIKKQDKIGEYDVD